MAAITLALFLVAYWVSVTAKANPAYVGLSLSEDPVNPGSCDTQSHGQIKLIKDRLGDECLVVCSENANAISAWKFLDGRSTVGEYFDPAYDCSDVVDRVPTAKDGVYWIKNEAVSNVVKAWCDVTTDGGGFLLAAKKDGPITWTVPSSNETVQPFGDPHWSSIFGDMKMLDIRIQFSTTSEFEDTKADWSFRLANKRPFGELLVRNYGGCSGQNPGIGDVSYVKDLLFGKVVNTNFRCSLFSGHVSEGIGWGMMNKCLKMPCSNGYAIIRAGPPGYEVNLKFDDHGSFSYSAYNNATSSGLLYSSTSFIGCSDTKCCACYGPKGGTKNYCLTNCTAINGGTVTKNVHAWIWIRSSVPKRAWRKCIEYIKTDFIGRKQKYRINEETGIAEKGSCASSEEVKKSGSVLVAPNEKAVKKIPSAPGLLLYRSSDKKLFIQGKNGWNQIAMEKELKEIKHQEHEVLKKNILKRLENRMDNFHVGCRLLKLRNPSLSNGVHMINDFQAYCDMTNGGWTLIARFSNSDSKNWISNGTFWYNRISSFDRTTHPHDNRDMISEAFWKVTGYELKITRSDDSSHTALLQTTSNCLQGGTFRSKITSYGDFRNGAVWASNQCRGSCSVSYGGQYKTTAGFQQHSCSSNIQSSNYIGFWCDWSSGDGAVMMIGGGGNSCSRADHGIGITEANEAKFGGGLPYHDFGNGASTGDIPPSTYSLNLWIR